MKRLIVTADDFGLAVPVNEAVEIAHRHGVLTAASLMVTAPAAADAVMRARRLPRLGVGLHLVLVDGRPALPPDQIPQLVGSDGRFRSDTWGLGLKIFFCATAQRQLEAEMRAQLLAFVQTGIELDHVNAHHHFHLHPTLQDLLLRLAPEFGIRAIRVPREEPLLGWRATGKGLLGRLCTWLLHGRRAARMLRRFRAAGIACPDRVLGIGDSGRMSAERMRGYVKRLPSGVSELYVHPAVRRWMGSEAWPSDYECQAEFAALTDRSLPIMLRERGIEAVSFSALGARNR